MKMRKEVKNMGLIKNSNNAYIIQNVNSLDNNIVVKILENLKSRIDDIILFQYIESYNFKEMLINGMDDTDFLLEGYLEGFLSFEKESTRDKIEHEIRNILANEGNYNQLYGVLKTNPLALKKSIIDKIKKIIYFNVLSEREYLVPNFVHKNTVFKNNYVLNIDNCVCKLKEDLRFNVKWFKADSAEILKSAIIDDDFFTGVVAKNNNSLENFYCGFCRFETASDYDIAIYFGDDYDYKDQVIDSICKLL